MQMIVLLLSRVCQDIILVHNLCAKTLAEISPIVSRIDGVVMVRSGTTTFLVAFVFALTLKRWGLVIIWPCTDNRFTSSYNSNDDISMLQSWRKYVQVSGRKWCSNDRQCDRIFLLARCCHWCAVRIPHIEKASRRNAWCEHWWHRAVTRQRNRILKTTNCFAGYSVLTEQTLRHRVAILRTSTDQRANVSRCKKKIYR